VLAFRGTEPLELSDFQSDFDAVPEAGESNIGFDAVIIEMLVLLAQSGAE
jgi:hypothetical protein